MADKPKLNTVYELEGIDGETIRLTLAYRYLYQLRAKHRDQYDDYNTIMMKGAKDYFDNITILYTAYLCELIAEKGDTDGCWGFDEFMDHLPVDNMEVMRAVGMLVAPKKTMASAALS